MVLEMIGAGSQYAIAGTDSQGENLDGGENLQAHDW